VIRTSLSAAVLVLALSACDLLLENRQMGLMADDQGRIHILYRGCADQGEKVQRVEVLRVKDSLGGDDDQVVWRVIANAGRSDIDLVVGRPARSFRESVPLRGALTGEYTAVVSTSLTREVAQGFRVGDLAPNMVDVGDDRPVTRDRFEQIARQACQ